MPAPVPPLPRRAVARATVAGLGLGLAACSAGGATGRADPTAVDVRRLLERRSTALLRGDLPTAAGVYATSDREVVRRADERARAAGLSVWAVDLDPGLDSSLDSGLDSGGRSTTDVTGTLRVQVAGEGRAVAGAFRAGLVVRDGGPVLRRADGGTPQPWDLGAVQARVVDGGVLLLTGVQASEPVAVQAAADLGEATDRVDAVWGTDWPRGTAVVVVPEAADVARLAGLDPWRAESLDAVAVGLDAAGDDGRPAGVRVVLSVERFSALTELGRTVTLTHELVHVATRALGRAPGAVVPRWFTEGYADHVARLDRDVSAVALAGPLLTTAAPVDVPPDSAFERTDAEQLQIAYACAWTLVTSAARRAGTAAVGAWFRAVCAGSGVEAACQDTQGRSFAEVVATWRQDVAGHLVGWVP